MKEKQKGKENTNKGWTELEEQEMNRRYKLFEGYKAIHSMVASCLPGRTREQVRYKRGRLRKAATLSDGPVEAPAANNDSRWQSNPGEPPPTIHGVRDKLRAAAEAYRGMDGDLKIGTITLSLRGVDQNGALIESSALEIQKLLGKVAGHHRKSGMAKSKPMSGNNKW